MNTEKLVELRRWHSKSQKVIFKHTYTHTHTHSHTLQGNQHIVYISDAGNLHFAEPLNALIEDIEIQKLRYFLVTQEYSQMCSYYLQTIT